MIMIHISVAFNQNLTEIDGLVQDCSNSIALAMELLQSCTKLSKYPSYRRQQTKLQ